MIRELNTETFHEALAGAEFAVVDCYGDYCFACELLAPLFDSLAERMPGVSFLRINLTQNFETAEELQIFDFPTLLFCRRGEIVTKEIGSIDEDTFKAALSALLYR